MDRALAVDDLCAGAGSIRAALDTVGSVWAMAVLAALGTEPLRYSQLKRRVTGINDRMLTQILHRFVRDGLAERQGSGHSAYALTDIGREVSTAVGEFVYVIMKLAPEVARARARHDG